MRKKDLKRWYWAIDQMNLSQMAKFKSTAPTGHPIFRMNLPLFEYFAEKYKKLQKEHGLSSSSSSSSSGMVGWAAAPDPNDRRHYTGN